MKNPLLAAVALERGVPVSWLQLVSEGTLENPEFVKAIRQAAKRNLWDLVAPQVKNKLFIPEMQIKSLGGSLDQLLAQLELYSLDDVMAALNYALEDRLYDEAELGRKNVASRNKNNELKTATADERARAWQAQIDARKPGTSIAAERLRIAHKENLTDGAVKEALKGFRRRQRKIK